MVKRSKQPLARSRMQLAVSAVFLLGLTLFLPALARSHPSYVNLASVHGRRHKQHKDRHHKHKHPEKPAVQTFQGSCDFAGTVHFDPALTLLALPTTVTAEAPGQCSGTLSSNGAARQLNQARALYWAQSTGRQSCASNPGGTGGGYLLIADSRIDFAMVETRIGPNGHLELSGAGGGSMAASLSATGDPLATVATCAQSGVAESPLTISAESESGISG